MKFLLKLAAYALVIMFTAWIIPGIEVDGFLSAVIVALVLGLINTFIKPVLEFITLPLTILTLGLFSLILNAFLLMFASFVTPGFDVENFLSALFGSILIALLTMGLERNGFKA